MIALAIVKAPAASVEMLRAVVLDSASRLTEEDKAALVGRAPQMIVLSKGDLAQRLTAADVRAAFGDVPMVTVCATRGEGMEALRDALTAFWDAVRRDIREGRVSDAAEVTLESCLPRMVSCARTAVMPRLRRVINATGVVVHTNMGRSVLAEEAVQALLTAASGYCNLELDMTTGGRGSRHSLCESLICRLTGAEAALVVNNNAAAVLLLLDTFCKGGEAVVSRGELVEIGGSFRIPEVMAKSGALLRDVGATNRTHLRDYEQAVGEQTRALLRVHTSNYRIVGFHAAVAPEDLVALGRRHNLPRLALP